jgi:hypothetical protein
VTWDAYGQDLRENLEDLLCRVRSGASVLREPRGEISLGHPVGLDLVFRGALARTGCAD